MSAQTADDLRDERVKLLYKKMIRSVSTNSNMIGAELGVLAGSNAINGRSAVQQEDIYSASIPSSYNTSTALLAALTVKYEYSSGTVVNKYTGTYPSTWVAASPASVNPSTAMADTYTYGLTIDLWKAFVDGDISRVYTFADTSTNSVVVYVEKLILDEVSATLEGGSPTYGHPALVDAIQFSTCGGAYVGKIESQNPNATDNNSFTVDTIGNWVLQSDCGTLQFLNQAATYRLGSLNSNNPCNLFSVSGATSDVWFTSAKPPVISFWKYIGSRGTSTRGYGNKNKFVQFGYSADNNVYCSFYNDTAISDISSTSLAYYYPLESNLGNMALANMATGSPVYDLTLYNGAALQSASYKVGGSALYFNSSASQYAKISSFRATTGGVSVACWYRMTANGWTRLFDFGNGQGNDNFLWAPVNGCSVYNGVSVGLQPGGTTGSASYADDKWHHFVWTLTYAARGSLTSTWCLYIDAIQVYTTSVGAYPGTDVNLTSNLIGASNWAGDPTMAGYVDDFRIYHRVISASEVTQLCNTNAVSISCTSNKLLISTVNGFTSNSAITFDNGSTSTVTLNSSPGTYGSFNVACSTARNGYYGFSVEGEFGVVYDSAVTSRGLFDYLTGTWIFKHNTTSGTTLYATSNNSTLMTCNTDVTINTYYNTTTSYTKARGYSSRAGTTGGLSGNNVNLLWTAQSTVHIYIDDVDIGVVNTTTSDYRIKKDIVDQDGATALQKVSALRPVTYQIIDHGDLFHSDGITRTGFIAHEVKAIIDDAVDGEKDGVDENGNIKLQSILYGPIVSLLAKSLQELNILVDILSEKL